MASEPPQAQAQAQAQEAEIRATVEWFLETAEDREALESRIHRAQELYRAGCLSDGAHWPETARLLPAGDLMAGWLAQARAALGDRRLLDPILGARILPFLASIGQQVELLRRRPGASVRVRRLLAPGLEHPAAGLFELAAACRFLREDFEISFRAESTRPVGDFALRIAEIPGSMAVACRWLQPGRQALRERALVRRQFAPVAQLVHDRALNLDIEIRYEAGLAHVPRHYLLDHVSAAIAAPSTLATGHGWRDRFGEGIVRDLMLERAAAPIRAGTLYPGAPLARAVTGREIAEDALLFAMRARPGVHDPRMVEAIDHLSILSWHCRARESLAARTRQLHAALAEVDRALEGAQVGIVHIGMHDVGDADGSADGRAAASLAALRAFQPRSRLAELHLHCFQPDHREIVHRHSRWHGFLLEDARLLAPDALASARPQVVQGGAAATGPGGSNSR